MKAVSYTHLYFSAFGFSACNTFGKRSYLARNASGISNNNAVFIHFLRVIKSVVYILPVNIIHFASVFLYYIHCALSLIHISADNILEAFVSCPLNVISVAGCNVPCGLSLIHI